MLSTLGLGADIDIQLYINSSDNVQSYPQIFLCHCAEGQGVHYVPPSEELEDHIDKSSAPPTHYQNGRNLPGELWQIIFKMTFQPFVYNGHITFAVKLILCITHVIVLLHWLRFIFKVFHKFILTFPMLSWRKRKAKSVLVF